MKYLTFQTKEDALARSEQEAIERGYSFHINGSGTRYATAPQETIDGTWVLSVINFNLTEAEEESTVDVYEPPAYEDLI